MTTDEGVREAIQVWRSANEKFDYYMVAVAGALVAWSVQTLEFLAFGWSAGLQVAGIAFLILAVAAGLARLQDAVHIYSLSVDEAKSAAAASQTIQIERQNHRINGAYDSTVIKVAEDRLASVRGEIRKSRRAAVWASRSRDFLLVSGLTLFAIGKVLIRF